MRRKLSLLLCALVLSSMAWAQPRRANVIELWPEGAPSDNGLTGPEIDRGTHVSNVTVPTLTVYVAKNPNGLAVISCPGGGYVDVWVKSEGHDMAEWYNEQGITYAVLKYRLPNKHKDIPLEDVHQAMKIMREHAAEWGFSKLGIQGNSAGGHLASTAATHFTSAENRPDFQILLYPVITFDPKKTHMGSSINLIGQNPAPELVKSYSNELQVTEDTPPAFIFHCTDDTLVPVCNSVDYYRALVDHKVSASLLVFPTGGHGFAFGDAFPYKRTWTTALEKWLSELNK